MNEPGISNAGVNRVLLIEDSDTDAMIIERLLTRSESGTFTTKHVRSVADAIRSMSESSYDVALLDLGLPDSSDLDGLHRLMAIEARFPIIVLTGNQDEELGLTAVRAGAQDYVNKDLVTGKMLSRTLRYGIARQHKVMAYALAANTDSLTGLSNRRAAKERFRELVESGGEPFGVSLLDIDHFKQVNDRYGHSVGDQAIQHFASLLRKELGDDHFVSRFGGEEFLIYFPGRSLGETIGEIEGLLAKLEDCDFIANQTNIRLTASAGATIASEDSQWDLICEQADGFLYQAKASGRNCCRGQMSPQIN